MGKMYLVGGAVRDELLGRVSKDFDYVVVGCSFEKLREQYGDPVGKDFPVFLDPKDGSEIAMARRERKTGVGYNGFTCDFGTDVTLEEDLSRRDLTINALAKNEVHDEIIDYFGGLQDLENKILRHVSPAFAEDPLRVVRLARFAARYNDFTIAPETLHLAQQVVDGGELNHIPYERYWVEISKAIDDGNVAKMFRVLNMFGVFSKVKFFNEVWGDKDIPNTLGRMEKVARSLRYSREEMRFTYFIALTAKDVLPARLHALNIHTLNVHRGVSQVNLMGDLEVAPLFELFKFAKVWQEGSLIEDIILGVELLNHSGHVTAVWPAELQDLVASVRKVTSEPYQHLEGKAIGDAMNQERKARIARLIEVF